MFVAAAGHDSRSIFVAISNSALLNWPFLLADHVLPASASTAVSDLGIAIHFAFYILLAWLLSYLFRGTSRPAA
jgi:hypothetical protein